MENVPNLLPNSIAVTSICHRLRTAGLGSLLCVYATAMHRIPLYKLRTSHTGSYCSPAPWPASLFTWPGCQRARKASTAPRNMHLRTPLHRRCCETAAQTTAWPLRPLDGYRRGLGSNLGERWTAGGGDCSSQEGTAVAPGSVSKQMTMGGGIRHPPWPPERKLGHFPTSAQSDFGSMMLNRLFFSPDTQVDRGSECRLRCEVCTYCELFSRGGSTHRRPQNTNKSRSWQTFLPTLEPNISKHFDVISSSIPMYPMKA